MTYHLRFLGKAAAVGPGLTEPSDLMEVMAYPRVSIPRLKGARDLSVLFARMFYAAGCLVRGDVEDLVARRRESQSGEHVWLQVRVGRAALAADQPPHPIYDPPAEWDEEQALVVPPGAVVVGKTEGYVGWTLFTSLHVDVSETAPAESLGFSGHPELPLWTVPAERLDAKLVREWLKSSRGRMEIASRLVKVVRWGPVHMWGAARHLTIVEC